MMWRNVLMENTSVTTIQLFRIKNCPPVPNHGNRTVVNLCTLIVYWFTQKGGQLFKWISAEAFHIKLCSDSYNKLCGKTLVFYKF